VIERGVDGETYCIGGSNQQTNLHVLQRICDLVDQRLGRCSGTAPALICRVDDRLGHDRLYAIDASKIRRQLGWAPRFEFESALGDVVDWYHTNDEWVRTIRSGEYLRFYEQQYGHRLPVIS